MQKIVCFSGQLASGKDTIADYLATRLNEILAADCGPVGCCVSLKEQERYDNDRWRRCAFGDAVKETYMRAFGVDREFVETWKRNDDPPPGYEKTVRKSLMFIGDGFRQIQPMIWINKLYEDNSSGGLVISDGRYDSEMSSVKLRQGVTILVIRPGCENRISHNSESQLVPHIEKLKAWGKEGFVEGVDVPFDWFIINDGSIEQLFEKIDEQLLPYLLKVLGKEGDCV